MTFNTSSIGAGATNLSAVLSIRGSLKSEGLGANEIHIAGSTQASNNSLAISDFQNVGRTSFASIAQASYSTAVYNDFSLNASGITNINKTGVSKFSAQLGWDLNNNFTGTWVSDADTLIRSYDADSAGTTNDPKLTITYTAPPPTPKQDVIWFD